MTVSVEASVCHNITANETSTIIHDLIAGETYNFNITAVSNGEKSVSIEIRPVNLGKILRQPSTLILIVSSSWLHLALIDQRSVVGLTDVVQLQYKLP